MIVSTETSFSSMQYLLSVKYALNYVPRQKQHYGLRFKAFLGRVCENQWHYE